MPFAAHITARSRRLISNYLRQCGDPYYTDSVTGDRTVVVRSPEGLTKIVPIERLWLEEAQAVGERRDGKQTGLLPGWEALARSSAGKEGWFPIGAIIRHETKKTLWKLSSKRGQTEVTEDHGIMVAGRPMGPEQFVREGQQFEQVRAMASRALQTIDIGPEVFGFGFDRSSHNMGTFRRSLGYAADGQIFLDGPDASPDRAQRIYKAGSPELHALLRLIGAYLSEGSTSIEDDGAKRTLFSVAQKDRGWCQELLNDLNMVTTSANGRVADCCEGMFALRSTRLMVTCLFAALCGQGSRGKRLPSFVYDLSRADFEVLGLKLMEGDGSREKVTRACNYLTISQELAAGLSYALDQRGIEHSNTYRPEKGCWTLRTRPPGTERNRSLLKVERLKPRQPVWVYDLSVEGAQTFVDGMGRVLLKNTDCLVTKDATLPCSDRLGDLKLEGRIKHGEYYAPKFYQQDVYVKDENGNYTDATVHKVKAKGFSRVGGVAFDHLIGKGLAPDTLDQLFPAGKKQMNEPAVPCTLVSSRQPAVVIERMMRSREMLLRGRTTPVSQLIPKQLRFSASNDKRVFEEGGHHSRPYTLTELEKLLGPGEGPERG